MKSQLNSEREKRPNFAALVRINPVILVIVVFFYMLGVCHGVDDLFRWLFSWPTRPGHDYEVATIAATTTVIVRSIFSGMAAAPRPANTEEE